MWIINIQHWLDATKTATGVPQLRLKVKKLSEITGLPPLTGPPEELESG
jgi:hypothetical protein